ncbi:MAG: methyltransferase domain-containing protein, partial [Actinobacteria bacterium]|nr:methyltransferase domain-containing protein [Actinomycetota bacterium]
MDVRLAGFVDGVPERFVPEVMRGELVDAEHRGRYWWVGGLVQGRRVLDAGCGIGYGSTILAESGAATVVGIDVAESVVEAARGRESAGVRFEVGNVQDLGFDDESFDVVVSFEVIEHLDDYTAALSEFARVLTPDGVLAVSSPNRAVYPTGNPHHTRELLPEELERELAKSFDHVRLFRQSDWITSAVLGDATFKAGDGTPLSEVELRKVAGREPGSETYTIAVAGNAPLPDDRQLAVLTEPVEFRRWLENYETQQRVLQGQADHLTELTTLLEDRDTLLMRLEEAERELADRQELLREVHERKQQVGRMAALEIEAAQAIYRGEMAEIALQDVVTSVSWRLTAPLRAVKRILRGERTASQPDAGAPSPQTPDEWA